MRSQWSEARREVGGKGERAMILGEGFEKFIERSPVSVMVRGTLERVFDPEK
jgi:hypothetical protein